jgi:Domain of unknown function (DUF4129)
MTGSSNGRGAALVAPTVALGMLVLVWAASTGPGQVFSGTPARRSIPTFLTETPEQSTSAGPQTAEEITRDVEQTLDLSWLGDLIAWAVLLGLGILGCLAVSALVRIAIRDRWLRPQRRPAVQFDVLPEERVAKALADDSAARLVAVGEGAVRNGIVRCWARLEDAVAEAGLPRAQHETSAEFTVRVLHALDLDPHAIGELARLYREARFSEHELHEDVRTEAREALLLLERDLGVVRGAS